MNMDPLAPPGIPAGPWAIVGVELEGAAPLGHVRIPLVGHRMSVLYGLNGAGKTIVLTALRAALRGSTDGAPLLRSFRLHIELTDPTADDCVMRELRGRMIRLLRRFSVETHEDAPLADVARSLLEARLSLITDDPCATPELRAGLAIPPSSAPVRATLDSTSDGNLRFGLALRLDDSAPPLLRALHHEHAVTEPGEPLLRGTAHSVVWGALGRSPEEPTDHRCALHVGRENAELLLEPEEQDFRAHPRAFTTRWANDWLFQGQLDALVSDGLPPSWESIAVVPVTRVDPAAILPVVASEDDDPRYAAGRAVGRIRNVKLRGEPDPPSTAAAELWSYGIRDVPEEPSAVESLLSEIRGQVHADWEEHDAAIMEGIGRDVLAGRELAPFAWAAQDAGAGADRNPVKKSPTGRTAIADTRELTRLRTALSALNSAVADWTEDIVAGIDTRRIVDRHDRFRRGDFWDDFKADDLEVRTDALSTAQERWLRIALAVLSGRGWTAGDMDGSARSATTPHLVLLVDEPEQSLHRDAERIVRGRLERLVREENASVIITSHSPIMLDSKVAVLNHVTMRRNGSVAIESGTDGSGIDLEGLGSRLGARISDLVGMQRVFVLVEGETDRIVLETLFGEELSSLRARVVPFGGTDALHAVVTPFKMLALTEASVVVVLDHVDNARMAAVWEEARQINATKGPNRAVIELARRSFDRHAERTAAGLAKEAIKQGQLERFALAGIDAIDILELVPFQALGCTLGREDLEHAKQANASQRWTSQRTKDWLREHGADLSPSSIRAAVEGMDSVPPNLLGVLEAIRKASERHPGNLQSG